MWNEICEFMVQLNELHPASCFQCSRELIKVNSESTIPCRLLHSEDELFCAFTILDKDVEQVHRILFF